MTSLADHRATAISDRSRTGEQRPAALQRRRYVPLLQRIAGINVLLVVAAVAVTIVVLAPGRISAPERSEEAALVLAAVALVVVANVLLLRRVVAPVQALTAFARRVDYANLGQRMPGAEPTSEAGELALTFNEMLTSRRAVGRATVTPLKARILLADDHAVVRRGLRLVLETQPDLSVVAEAGDGIEAVQKALAEDVDLAILDIWPTRPTRLAPAPP
jgi:HAMP domain-containing protein